MFVAVRERDPDVIEGHNIFSFDLTYILDRCEMYGVDFAVGRDGSVPRTYDSSMRFAERTVEFEACEIAGRHVVDTFLQVMSYDVFKRDLPGYGLKEVARYFGFAPEGRTYVEGADIARAWREEPERLLRYALDDVVETGRLARHLSGSSFYLTQMLPMPYGQVARTGHLSATARQLHVSQSALSTQIRALEERLGATLFDRRQRRLRLTEAGHHVFAYAERIFAEGEALVAQARSGRLGARDTLRLGAVATLSRNFLELFIEPLLRRPDSFFSSHLAQVPYASGLGNVRAAWRLNHLYNIWYSSYIDAIQM